MNKQLSPLYDLPFNVDEDDTELAYGQRFKVNHKTKKTTDEIINEIAEPIGLESGFNTTYEPSRYEKGWLLSAVRYFYEEHFISDVLTKVRGGKEASVYLCRAEASLEIPLLAAKVYRPRKFRVMRNDKVYREGRPILKADGNPVKNSDDRIMRAVGKKTAFGIEVEQTSWLMYEYTAMQKLYQAGASIPQPFAVSGNAILMTYYGNESLPAPTLNEVELEEFEVRPLFEEVMRNIAVMLQHNYIHGDLSAYNLLYWQGKVTVIDFPQVVRCDSNNSAYRILSRDIQRICDYFHKQGLSRESGPIAAELWDTYVGLDPNPQPVDLGNEDVIY